MTISFQATKNKSYRDFFKKKKLTGCEDFVLNSKLDDTQSKIIFEHKIARGLLDPLDFGNANAEILCVNAEGVQRSHQLEKQGKIQGCDFFFVQPERYAWLKDLDYRFTLIPKHAKAYGWKSLDNNFFENIEKIRRKIFFLEDLEDKLFEPHFCKQLRLIREARFIIDLDYDHLSFIGYDEDQICSLAASKVKFRREMLASQNDGFGLTLQQKVNDRKLTAYLKSVCEPTVKRKLFKEHSEYSYHISRGLELVGSHKGSFSKKYISDIETKFYQSKQHSKLLWSNKFGMFCGDKFVSMADLIEGKRRTQRARMYAITKGMDEVAQEKGWKYGMLTLTLPGEYRAARTGKSSGRKSEWNLSEPRECARQLQYEWNIVGTSLKKIFAKYDGGLGFLVREPHKDGTPHIHVSIVASSECQVEIRKFCLDYSSRRGEDVNEPLDVLQTTSTRRLHYLAWKCALELEDEGKKSCSPASYMFKYLTKSYSNLDISAWKSFVGIRSISWLGMGRGFVSRWDAIYRLTQAIQREEIEHPLEDEALSDIISAMDAGHFGVVLATLAGVDIPEVERPLRLEPLHEEKVTQFYETYCVLLGFTTAHGTFIASTGEEEWEMRQIDFDNKISYTDTNSKSSRPPDNR